ALGVITHLKCGQQRVADPMRCLSALTQRQTGASAHTGSAWLSSLRIFIAAKEAATLGRQAFTRAPPAFFTPELPIMHVMLNMDARAFACTPPISPDAPGST